MKIYFTFFFFFFHKNDVNIIFYRPADRCSEHNIHVMRNNQLPTDACLCTFSPSSNREFHYSEKNQYLHTYC